MPSFGSKARRCTAALRSPRSVAGRMRRAVGGTAGAALLVQYVTGIQFWLGFSLINVPFYLLGWTPSTADSHNVMYDIMGCRDNPASSRGLTNVAGYCNKDFDALADKVLQETDSAKRDLLIKAAFELSNKDFAYIPLHQQALAWGVSKKLKV
eukprot:gene41853-56673_t